MERKRFYDRDQFTTEEKYDIGAKSDNKCCHCGTYKFFPYGATVDHFIPLHRGGSNRFINLIMMCEDCNKEKGDKIVDMTYVPYLKEEYKKQLRDYLDSYLEAFDYIERKKIFALDQYSVMLMNKKLYEIQKSSKKHSKVNNIKPFGINYLIKSATEDDFERLADYFEKYLKKYDRFFTREAVEADISFWLKFGCIYYLERNGEIAIMTVFTVKHLPESDSYKGIDQCLNLRIFSYYSTDTAFSICGNIVTEFPRYIINEQHLAFIPVEVVMLEDDKLTSNIFRLINNGDKYKANPLLNDFVSVCMLVLDEVRNENSPSTADDMSPDEEPTEEDIEKTKNFFNKFKEMGDALAAYMKKDPESEWADWMLYDILSCYDIKKLGIFDDNKDLKELNDSLIEFEDKYAQMKKNKERRKKQAEKQND